MQNIPVNAALRVNVQVVGEAECGLRRGAMMGHLSCKFARPPLVVSVQKRNKIAPRGLYPRVARACGAYALKSDRTQARILARLLRKPLPGAVAGPVIDDDHFKIDPVLVAHALDRHAKVGEAIAGRNDDAA